MIDKHSAHELLLWWVLLNYYTKSARNSKKLRLVNAEKIFVSEYCYNVEYSPFNSLVVFSFRLRSFSLYYFLY